MIILSHAHNACVAMVKSRVGEHRARQCAHTRASGDEAQDHENLWFSERILNASKFIVGSIASLSLGARIVTELTVLELRGHAYGLGKAR